MELRDLIADRRRDGPGSIAKSGCPYLVEEGLLLLETKEMKVGTTTRIVQQARDDHEIALDMTRRHVFRLVGRRGEVVVGRGDEADVRLELSSVSRRHSILRGAGTAWTVEDAGSTNGTYLDGERLVPGTARPLASSSVLRFGPEVKLTFLDPEALERFVGQLEAALAADASSEAASGEAVDMSRSKVLGKGALPSYLDDDDTAQEDPSLPPPVPVVKLTSRRASATPPAPAKPLAVACRPFPPLALVEGRPIVVGRVAGNDLVLPHPLVSRRHAQLERQGDEVTVIDLGSANGVLVDGARVERGPVPIGATVAIGPYELKVIAAEAETPQGPAGGATIAILGQVSLRGVLDEIPLAEVLSGIEFNRKTGVIDVVGPDADGSITFRDGQPLRARSGALSGEAAVKKLLSIRSGRFTIRADEMLTTGPRDIAATFTKLLLDHGRETDEGRA